MIHGPGLPGGIACPAQASGGQSAPSVRISESITNMPGSKFNLAKILLSIFTSLLV